MSSVVDAATLRRRERLVLIGSAGLLTAFAWYALIHGHVPSPGGPPASLAIRAADLPTGGFLVSVATWMIMIIAMMTPAVLPWIVFFAMASRGHSPTESLHLPVVLFTIGYFVVFGTFSVAGTGLQLILHHFTGNPPGDSMTAFSGLALIVAGAYQWSPFKTTCLRHCRSPLGFFLSNWRDGPMGSFSMGLRHGAYCLGCCWALMGLMLVVGGASLVWMVILTILIVIEQLVPWGPTVGRVTGWFFMGAGGWIVSGLPGL